MANLIDLRRRIRSIKNTQALTKAMKMVAAAKLRRAQDAIMATRPYALELQKVTRNLSGADTGDYEHPLMMSSPGDGEGKTLLAVVTGDKGMCGSFNSNVIRRAETFLAEHEKVDLLLLGRRGADYFGRRRTPIRKAYSSLFTNVTYDHAQEIGDDVIAAFTAGEYSSVHVIYNQFVSVLTQNLTVEQVLPLSSDLASDEGETEVAASETNDYLYEPSPAAILDALLPRFVIFQFYRALLESQAAEHGARMSAMDNATKNAGELIDSLSLTYNRQRQAAITTELIEVVSGANALDG